MMKYHWLLIILLTVAVMTACYPAAPAGEYGLQTDTSVEVEATLTPSPLPQVTLPAERPQYAPGELVDYIVQSGDILTALAVRFNTTEEEIRQANPIIPAKVTTLPMGLPMQIPIYYRPLWGSSYQIIPDSVFVNGPNEVSFDVVAYVDSSKGWLKGYQDFINGKNVRGGEIIVEIANNYSISPRLLLTLLEYQTGALSAADTPDFSSGKTLGFNTPTRTRLSLQLNYAANVLNNAYYDYRQGKLLSFTHQSDGRLEYIDPWQNAASAALMVYYSRVYEYEAYRVAISDQGIQKTFHSYFGDPWLESLENIPGSLTVPQMQLPFEAGIAWTYTGGPHSAWGDGEPWAAIDFAPPGVSGCKPSPDWVTAVADGVIARTDEGQVVLDLDGDGDERTGWVVFYLHIATDGKIQAGQVVTAGSVIGHPSCEGGSSTGTHVHMARKYNGEWVPAHGVLPFDLEGWIVQSSGVAYKGTLVRFSNVVTATDYSGIESQISSDPR